jgi:hypothetical protein
MTKELSDILGRLSGDMLALQGMESKISPPPSSPPVTTEVAAQPQAPPAKLKKEDYDYTKKLLEEIAGLAKSASDEIDKELKVPPSPLPEAEGASAPNKEATGTQGAHKK